MSNPTNVIDVTPGPAHLDRSRRKRTYHPAGGKLMTKQSDADHTDLNAIVSRYRATGQLPIGKTNPGAFGDFTSAESYFDMRLTLDQAEEEFELLPAAVRDRYGNRVEAFLNDFLDGGEVGAELREELGFREPSEGDPEGSSPEPPAAEPPPSEPPKETPPAAE